MTQKESLGKKSILKLDKKLCVQLFALVRQKLKDKQQINTKHGEIQEYYKKAGKNERSYGTKATLITTTLQFVRMEELYELLNQFLLKKDSEGNYRHDYSLEKIENFSFEEFSSQIASYNLEKPNDGDLTHLNIQVKNVIDFQRLFYELRPELNLSSSERSINFENLKLQLEEAKAICWNFRCPKGKQLIHFAVKFKLPDVCEFLIKNKVNNVNAYIRSEKNGAESKRYSVLGYALKVGNSDVVKVLIRNKANWNCVHQWYEYNIWHVATLFEKIDFWTKCLVDCGFSDHVTQQRNLIFSPDHYKCPPLYMMIYKGLSLPYDFLKNFDKASIEVSLRIKESKELNNFDFGYPVELTKGLLPSDKVYCYVCSQNVIFICARFGHIKWLRYLKDKGYIKPWELERIIEIAEYFGHIHILKLFQAGKIDLDKIFLNAAKLDNLNCLEIFQKEKYKFKQSMIIHVFIIIVQQIKLAFFKDNNISEAKPLEFVRKCNILIWLRENVDLSCPIRYPDPVVLEIAKKELMDPEKTDDATFILGTMKIIAKLKDEGKNYQDMSNYNFAQMIKGEEPNLNFNKETIPQYNIMPNSCDQLAFPIDNGGFNNSNNLRPQNNIIPNSSDQLAFPIDNGDFDNSNNLRTQSNIIPSFSNQLAFPIDNGNFNNYSNLSHLNQQPFQLLPLHQGNPTLANGFVPQMNHDWPRLPSSGLLDNYDMNMTTDLNIQQQLSFLDYENLINNNYNVNQHASPDHDAFLYNTHLQAI